MSEPVAYGLDFGTSNSAVAAYMSDGSIETVPTDPDLGALLPSLVFLHRDGNQLAGTLAAEAFVTAGTAKTRCRGCSLVDWDGGEPLSPCRQARPQGFCMDSRLISQVKASLADQGFDITHSWGRDFGLAALVAIVLRHLKSAADRHYSTDVQSVAIGHPVRFAGAEGPAYKSQQAKALERLEEAAHLAGFTRVALVPESQAAVALHGVEDGFVMATDFGGGTFDCAVADVMGDDLEILALDGVAVGGEDFDGLLFDRFVRPAMGLDREFRRPDGQVRQLPARLRARLRTLSGLRTLLTDPELVSLISGGLGSGGEKTLQMISELLFGGQAVAFYRAIEQAKIDLSASDTTFISFRRPGIVLNEKVTRADFEQLIEASMDRIRSCLIDACSAAGITPADVSFVTRTGGSSQIPLFADVLGNVFPNARLIESDPFAAVVHGLAGYAGVEWENA